MNIVVGVSGGIAAYKAPDLVRRLREAGADVRLILTPNAARFVSPLSLSAVSNHPVIVDQWGDPEKGGVDHIELARWAELLLIAPATANIIAKLTAGIADDALSTYAVAHRGPIVVAPSMNTFMFRNRVVQENLATLRARGVAVIDPDSGFLACGDEGEGRMPDPKEIAAHVSRLFHPRDFEGIRVLVTAGPTREPIDPVRYITNRSSGKMGYALASAAHRRGATVTLVTGPVSLSSPPGIDVHSVETADEMLRVVREEAKRHDVLIMAAAVGDYTPEAYSEKKIKKGANDSIVLPMKRTADIVSEVASSHPRPLIVAFAAETENVVEYARRKLEEKRLDLIVANDVSDRSIGFDSDENEVVVVDRDGGGTLIPRSPKIVIADRILDRVLVERSGRPVDEAR